MFFRSIGYRPTGLTSFNPAARADTGGRAGTFVSNDPDDDPAMLAIDSGGGRVTRLGNAVLTRQPGLLGFIAQQAPALDELSQQLVGSTYQPADGIDNALDATKETVAEALGTEVNYVQMLTTGVSIDRTVADAHAQKRVFLPASPDGESSERRQVIVTAVDGRVVSALAGEIQRDSVLTGYVPTYEDQAVIIHQGLTSSDVDSTDLIVLTTPELFAQTPGEILGRDEEDLGATVIVGDSIPIDSEATRTANHDFLERIGYVRIVVHEGNYGYIEVYIFDQPDVGDPDAPGYGSRHHLTTEHGGKVFVQHQITNMALAQNAGVVDIDPADADIAVLTVSTSNGGDYRVVFRPYLEDTAASSTRMEAETETKANSLQNMLLHRLFGTSLDILAEDAAATEHDITSFAQRQSGEHAALLQLLQESTADEKIVGVEDDETLLIAAIPDDSWDQFTGLARDFTSEDDESKNVMGLDLGSGGEDELYGTILVMSASELERLRRITNQEKPFEFTIGSQTYLVV